MAVVVATVGGAVLFSRSGIFNVAASNPHSNIVEEITHQTMVHSVGARAGQLTAPATATPAQVVSGFCSYQAHCEMCHGAAGVARQPWVSGMTPDPPYLLDAPRNWTPAQLFWIVKHGIKMTGMPAWEEQMSDAEIWNVVAFMEATNRVSPQAFMQLRARRACGPAAG